MSGNHFHVHGPHDHELEHAAQHGANDSFSGRIAVITALLATVGALFSYQGGVTQVNAMLAKNDAQIKKTSGTTTRPRATSKILLSCQRRSSLMTCAKNIAAR